MLPNFLHPRSFHGQILPIIYLPLVPLQQFPAFSGIRYLNFLPRPLQPLASSFFQNQSCPHCASSTISCIHLDSIIKNSPLELLAFILFQDLKLPPPLCVYLCVSQQVPGSCFHVVPKSERPRPQQQNTCMDILFQATKPLRLLACQIPHVHVSRRPRPTSVAARSASRKAGAWVKKKLRPGSIDVCGSKSLSSSDPHLKHYCDIVSDIPSGSIYGISILTFYLTIYFYLTFFLAY